MAKVRGTDNKGDVNYWLTCNGNQINEEKVPNYGHVQSAWRPLGISDTALMTQYVKSKFNGSCAQILPFSGVCTTFTWRDMRHVFAARVTRSPNMRRIACEREAAACQMVRGDSPFWVLGIVPSCELGCMYKQTWLPAGNPGLQFLTIAEVLLDGFLIQPPIHRLALASPVRFPTPGCIANPVLIQISP